MWYNVYTNYNLEDLGLVGLVYGV